MKTRILIPWWKIPYSFSVILFLLFTFLFPSVSNAQTKADENVTLAKIITSTSSASTSDTLASSTKRDIPLIGETKDLTKPEEQSEKEAVLKLLEKRPVNSPGIFSFLAWWVQHSINVGIPANTIVLILLLPILAAIVAFIRVIVGLPTLEMLVPIALAYVFVAVGIVIGGIILMTVVAASFLSRILLRHVSLMHYPKRSLSMLLFSLMIFAVLTISIQLGLGNIQDLSIFPVLIVALLGDSIVSVQLRKSLKETFTVTAVTIGIALCGFMLATMDAVRDVLIVYPEVIFIIIPINVFMGRYFGLRLSEVFRFRNFYPHGSE